MTIHRGKCSRRGAILVLVAISLVVVCGFVALAVDVGMIAVAKTEAQNAADTASMIGARTLNGADPPNLTQATTAAKNGAKANKILHQFVTDPEVAVTHGAFHYDQTNKKFVPQYPPVAPDNYNLTKVTVTRTRDTAFARAIGVGQFTVSATSVAAHRPRDVMIILDFSGSMNNESDIWNNEGYLGSANNSPNNRDTLVPTWGHYAATNAQLVCTSTDSRVGRCNITASALGMPPMVNDFHQHARGTTPTALAFTPADPTYATTPNGDAPLPGPLGQIANNVTDITGGASIPFVGYLNFQGFTQGPGHWGKTFFIWPPDPNPGNPAENNVPKDWRRRFFLKADGTTPVDDNRLLWEPDGDWRDPVDNLGTNYKINYKAILDWIKNTGPNPFPPMLRGGRILYYDQIPNDVPAAAYTYGTPASTISDPDERFWKEYIDYVLGVWLDPYGNATTVASSNRSNGTTKIQRPGLPACSYGPDFVSGTVQITGPLAGLPLGPGDANGVWNRIDPSDNPKRPRHRFWFGPMTMVQFISDTGLLPGNAHDISMYSAKLGIDASLEDIKNNHPNDLVSMILFNRPRFDGEPVETGRFSKAQFHLSRDYTAMQKALWWPPNSGVDDVRPWDSNGVQTPRSYGDYTGNTTSNYGFMIAYNQMSDNTTLQPGFDGGFGRKGAQRLIIFETDGMANVRANAQFDTNGYFYKLGPSDNITPGGSPADGVYAAVDKIVALETDLVNGPGYATTRKPVIIHCIAFGAVVEPNADGGETANIFALLNNVAAKGNTAFPANENDTSHPEYYKVCIGTLTERRDKLQTAFRKIMEEGIPVTLVE
jgi:Flp pilus assembly protein TadG